METAPPRPSSQAKAWIILVAGFLMVAPFVVLAVRQTEPPRPAGPSTAGMVWIPGGEFTMGTSKADEKHAEEAPGHAVVVKGFWMDVTEVTNAQFQAFVDATQYVTDTRRTSTRGSSPRPPRKCSRAAPSSSGKSPA